MREGIRKTNEEERKHTKTHAISSATLERKDGRVLYTKTHAIKWIGYRPNV
jgi:hypothetical protein